MKNRMFRPGYIDTARPLPFQMRNARWLEGEPGDDPEPEPDSDPEPGDDPDEGDPEEDDPEPDDDGADELGDKGKQALARMKEKWRTERAKRREYEQKLADATTKDQADADRRKVESEALAKANARIVRSEVKAAAAGKLADPSDAYKFLDLDQFEVDDDGNVDEDEIAEAIEGLIKNKPYLAAQGGRRFQGGADGGTRKAARPKQLTRADLAGMTPQQIADAKAKGQLDDLLKNPKN